MSGLRPKHMLRGPVVWETVSLTVEQVGFAEQRWNGRLGPTGDLSQRKVRFMLCRFGISLPRKDLQISHDHDTSKVLGPKYYKYVSFRRWAEIESEVEPEAHSLNQYGLFCILPRVSWAYQADDASWRICVWTLSCYTADGQTCYHTWMKPTDFRMKKLGGLFCCAWIKKRNISGEEIGIGIKWRLVL